ncbi:microtubule-associated serine/threonine-protein kinase 3-like [Anomaloglossus baeobatrachus]|uniref:microtubule-associated serine/threonine-protein kinase 3-like n=1 Tax=Anomaloglossus baeobatrachus TaxID=238106 RepID=UPI003F504A93
MSRLIGSGGFGAVNLVRHKDSQKIFAMKKLDKQELNTPTKIEQAFLERDILSFIDCPFVVSMLCSFPTTSHLCMVMEHVGGGDCASLLSTRGPLPVSLARLYFAETVLAVEYLHSYGVVHRDLKPDNLLITSAGHIKVTDFGLSKVGLMMPKTNIYQESAGYIAREFRDREFWGTTSYIAPEVILKQGYGRPVDWWSMGIILYEFLVGVVPFEAKYIHELYKKIVSVDIIWTCDPAPPLDAQNLIIELLRKNPVHRLGTGGANEIKCQPFLSDLDFENLLSQEPEYVPQRLSDPSDVYLSMVSEDEDRRNEDYESFHFQNFTSSSERLCKLCTISTRMMSNEDPKCPPESSQASNTKTSEMQKESPPVSDRDDAVSSVPSSSPLSESPVQEEENSAINVSEEPKSQNEEQQKKSQDSPAQDKEKSPINVSEESKSENGEQEKIIQDSPAQEEEQSSINLSEEAKSENGEQDKMSQDSPAQDEEKSPINLSEEAKSENGEQEKMSEDSPAQEEIKSPINLSEKSKSENGEQDKISKESPAQEEENSAINQSEEPKSKNKKQGKKRRELPAQEEEKSINQSEEPKSENKERGKKRRGSIFRRFISSCRRGLVRAARVFACCNCSSIVT